MKKITILLATAIFLIGCSDDFLERTPKGRYHAGNYKGDEIDKDILIEAKLAETYAKLRSWPFVWSGLAMNNYTTPDVEKGSTPSDGGSITEFKTLSFTTSNFPIQD